MMKDKNWVERKSAKWKFFVWFWDNKIAVVTHAPRLKLAVIVILAKLILLIDESWIRIKRLPTHNLTYK